MLHREGIQPSSPFFFFSLAVATANLTSAWMKEPQCRKMTCCAVWREMSFMGNNTANGVIIYDHCILLFLSLTSSFCRACSVMRKEPYFTVLFTYSCNNPLCSFPFTFILIFYSIYDYGLCGAYRRRVMNKLSIRVKAKSYSEVTCILLPF